MQFECVAGRLACAERRFVYVSVFRCVNEVSGRTQGKEEEEAGRKKNTTYVILASSWKYISAVRGSFGEIIKYRARKLGQSHRVFAE